MIDIDDNYIYTSDGHQLWLGRMGDKNGAAILLIHGAIENSKIFYSINGKGLAPFLAENGYDVFLTDLRGKGKSTPESKSGKVTGGQFEVITQDLPAIMNEINKIKGQNCPIHLMAHSWGGVLISAFMARFSSQFSNVQSIVFFASKRKIYVQHLKRWIMVDLAWTVLGSLATHMAGYLPARRLRMGADDEPAQFYFQCNKWVYSNSWIDPIDQFNYHKAFEKIKWPPIFSLTGLNDHSLGNIKCVHRMLNEMLVGKENRLLLSKSNGNLHNYGHIDILTHPDAPNDHFRFILNWLNQHN